MKLYRKDELLRHAPGPRVSPHDPGVKETLLSLDFAGDGPAEVLLVGVVPAEVAAGTGLSPAVRGRPRPRPRTAVLEELARLGHEVAPPRTARPARPVVGGHRR